MTQPKDTNEQALRESQVDELKDILIALVYGFVPNSELRYLESAPSEQYNELLRSLAAITALRVRDRIDELRGLAMHHSIQSMDKAFHDQELEFIEKRIAELESQLNTGKSK